MDSKRKIFVCIDQKTFEEKRGNTKAVSAYTYLETLSEISAGTSDIVTTDVSCISFSLVDKGFEVFVCKGDKIIRIDDSLKVESDGKEVRYLWVFAKEQLLSVFKKGIFDKFLGISVETHDLLKKGDEFEAYGVRYSVKEVLDNDYLCAVPTDSGNELTTVLPKAEIDRNVASGEIEIIDKNTNKDGRKDI